VLNIQYSLYPETAKGVKPSGVPAGTCEAGAVAMALQELRKPGVRTVAVRHGIRLVGIYDHRDLPEGRAAEEEFWREDDQ
jgi:hypothetical protein